MDLNQVMDPAYVSRLKGLPLKAQFILAGSLAGRHLSPFHGFSAEFHQYKAYDPGDDLKYLDWKVFGKSDQLVVKQFRDETNTNVYLVVDSSKSMGYGGEGGEEGQVTKLEYLSALAASIGLLAFRQRDAVSLIHGAAQPTLFIPPRNSAANLTQVFKALETLRPEGSTDLKALFEKVALHLKSGSMTFIFTDLWQDANRIVAGLKEIRHRNRAITLVQVLSPEEIAFLEDANVELEDLETGEKLQISARHLKTQYLGMLGKHMDILRTECFKLNVRLVPISIKLPYFKALQQILPRSGS